MKNKIKSIKLNNFTIPNPTNLLSQTNKWVTNGPDNSYFYYIESLYISSPTNQAIIDNITNYILGDGLEDINGNKLDNILSEEDLRCAIQDFKLYGSCVLQVIYSILNEKKIAKLIYIPTKSVAIAKQDDLSDEIEGYFYSFDWRYKTKFKPYFIPAFGYGENNETELLRILRPSGNPLFPLSDWVSANQWCQVEAEMSNFSINHIQKSFSVAKIININKGTVGLSEEDLEDTKNSIISELTGTDGERVIVSFNESKEQETTISDIQIQDAYKQFEGLSKQAEEKILRAHKITSPTLFGIAKSTGFSSQAEEMNESLKLLYRSQINPLRQIIIKELERALKINADYKLQFKDFDDIKTDNIE